MGRMRPKLSRGRSSAEARARARSGARGGTAPPTAPAPRSCAESTPDAPEGLPEGKPPEGPKSEPAVDAESEDLNSTLHAAVTVNRFFSEEPAPATQSLFDEVRERFGEPLAKRVSAVAERFGLRTEDLNEVIETEGADAGTIHAIDCDLGEDCTCGVACAYCADSGEVNEVVDGSPKVLSCPECEAGAQRERFLKAIEQQHGEAHVTESKVLCEAYPGAKERGGPFVEFSLGASGAEQETAPGADAREREGSDGARPQDEIDVHPEASSPEAAIVVASAAAPLERFVPKRYGPRDVFEAFLKRRAKTTLRAYKQDVTAFAAWLGVASPEEATAKLLEGGVANANAMLLSWLDDMQKQELASATQARRLSSMKSLVKSARLIGVVEWSIDVQAPKIQPYRDTRGPGSEQLQKMFDACDDSLQGKRDRAILEMAAKHALRRFEIATMRVCDIDRVTGSPRLRVVGKGNKESWITLGTNALAAIDAWLEAWREKSCGFETSDSPVFRSLSNHAWGRPLRPDGVYEIVAAIGKRAGVKTWPHAIRHTAITRYLEKTNDLRKAQTFARHSDPRTTQIYDDNRRDEAADGSVLDEEWVKT